MWDAIRQACLTLAGLGLCAAASLTGLSPAVAQPRVVDVRIGDHAGATRLVLEMTEPASPEISVLSAPNRVVLDLPEVAWALPMNAVTARGGVIESFRFGVFTAGRSRMVLDVKAPVLVKSAFMIEPRGAQRFRFVVDLERAAAPGRNPAPRVAQQAQRSPAPPAAEQQVAVARPLPMPPAAPTPPKPRAPGDGRHLVVIDAGHGGVDPGTIGKGGTYEKDVTLAMARVLKKRMEATGRYRVVLTRDSDVFIALRDRVTLARSGGAEMFISLHADANPNHAVRGGAVYTLSEVASDKEAELLAAKENKADLIAGIDLSHENPEVTSILLDLAQRETKNYSARFAAMLVEELGRSVRLLGNSHRFAGFAVLKAPDVPSVLVEMGYLSNRAEEKLLNQADHRRKLADGIVRAADRFFRERARSGR